MEIVEETGLGRRGWTVEGMEGFLVRPWEGVEGREGLAGTVESPEVPAM